MIVPDAARGLRRVFVRNLLVEARLGVLPHEHTAAQRVRISIDLAVLDEAVPGGVGPDTLARVVDYARVADLARREAAAGHTRLVETLAERIAVACCGDPRVQRANVRVEKPDALSDAEAVGVEVQRCRPEAATAC